MVSIERANEARAKLSALGIEAAWGEYEMGHEIRPNALKDLAEWLGGGPFANASIG